MKTHTSFFALLLAISLFTSFVLSKEPSPSEDDEELYVRDVSDDSNEVKSAEKAAQSSPSSSSNPTDEQIKEAIRLQQEERNSRPSNYYIEFLYGSLIIAYAANFFMGKKTNESLAKSWAEATSKILRNNFSKLGEGKSIGIIKVTQSVFKVVATGRVNCQGLQATLDLKKRHDLFSVIVELFTKKRDTLTLDIPMNNDSLDSFVYAIVRKREEKKYRRNFKDLNSFTKPATSVPGLHDSFCVLSEFEELSDFLLNDEVLATLRTYHDLFVSLHVSDQSEISPKYKKFIRIELNLPNQHQMEKLSTLIKMVVYFIDRLADARLSKQAKVTAEKHRAQVAELESKKTRLQREEAAQEKKIAKKQKIDAAFEKMTPEEQRKFEEKMQKREMKKRMQSKGKVIVG